MLTTLLAWIYITFLSWMWGVLFLQTIKKITKTEGQLPHFSIVCITGLSAITIIAGMLSLVMPLGSWWVQLFFITPCLALLLKKNVPSFFISAKKEFLNLHLLSSILLYSCLLLILVMCTWTIVHPDTLGYHAQTIQWIEKYKAVPGLVHLHVRFGYQGLWFVDCALFGFSFTGKAGITFLNSTVLLWFFIFMINRINFNFFKDGSKIVGLLWVALLFLSMWSYTQVRLTATSASPDFIATLFVLAIVYTLFLETRFDNWLLPAFLSLAATTIKLSVAPLLMIAIAACIIFIKRRKLKSLFTLFLISAIAFFPFIARNIITTGYIVFPSTAIDIASTDWKYSAELTTNEKNYITAYAKKPGVITKEEIDKINEMSPADWLPGWWQHRSTADKTIIVLLILSFFTALSFAARIIKQGFVPILVILTMLAGIIFWFLQAPDPRFGFGSILGFIAVIIYLSSKELEIHPGKRFLIALMLASIVVVITYTGYRFINFFGKEQLLTPLGIERSGYRTFDCDGLKINTPLDGKFFGITPIPCTDLECGKFSPRGNETSAGFNAK
jgi:hypothetical protein